MRDVLAYGSETTIYPDCLEQKLNLLFHQVASDTCLSIDQFLNSQILLNLPKNGVREGA